MSVRYQRGHLRCVKRKNGSSCWEFLWREIGPAGKPKRRTMMIGTLEQFPTAQLAANAVNGLRVSINVERIRQRQAVLMSDLIDHYILTDCPSKSARIQKRIGWHTFRHTYSTLLVSNGENVKVIQELIDRKSTRLNSSHGYISYAVFCLKK